ncbi:MAG: hypothetical protein LBP74_01355 [Treponema sp.]|nr:hypothetical protein [Treponema sp.]
MNSRERVRAAMSFKKPDRVPVQYYYCPVGYYEHGDKLNDLYASLEGDFAPFTRAAVPVLPDSDFDEAGNYHAFKRDEWGVLWEFRIFGIAGIPKEFPLADPEKIRSYTAPPAPEPPGDTAGAREKALAARNDGCYQLRGCGSLFERMIALRPEEEVLCDLISGEPYIHELADIITEHNAALVKGAVAAGADGVSFGDDYGTERNLIMSPALWRAFFKPRLKELFKPAVDAGLDVFFHSCGYVWELLPDFAEIGVSSVWPQLPAYDMKKLADRCRELHLAVAVHTDRAKTMTYGSPAEVRDLVLREYETFRLYDGGGWFYIEADNGFPWANLEALVHTIKEIR